MFKLATLPRVPALAGLLSDDVAVDDGSGNGASTIDQITDFANSASGQNIVANILNMTSTATTGKPAVFVNSAGQVSTPTTAINPQILIFGAVALGLLLYFNKKG